LQPVEISVNVNLHQSRRMACRPFCHRSARRGPEQSPARPDGRTWQRPPAHAGRFCWRSRALP
jgi:hypothetical protein